MELTSKDLFFNHIALWVAIEHEVTVETAFHATESFLQNPFKNVSMMDKAIPQINNDDVVDMINLKKELTYKQIGKIYGISESGAYHRMSKFKRKQCVGS